MIALPPAVHNIELRDLRQLSSILRAKMYGRNDDIDMSMTRRQRDELQQDPEFDRLTCGMVFGGDMPDDCFATVCGMRLFVHKDQP